MKKCWVVVALILLLLSCFIGFFRNELAFISITGAGYASKNACSIIFVGERDLQSAIEAEFNFPPISIIFNFVIDEENKCVTATSLLGYEKKACYRSKELGCSIVYDEKLISESVEKNLYIPAFHIENVITTVPFEELKDIEWPAGYKIDELLVEKAKSGINFAQLDKLVNEHFENKDYNARAFIVVKDGQIIYEKYGNNFNEHSKLLGWSMSKSVLASLINIRIKEGYMSLDDGIHYPWYNSANDERVSSVTVRALLQMIDGLDFEEDYLPWSDVPKMLYTEPSSAHFVGKRSLRKDPASKVNTCFRYSSGSTNILSFALRMSFDKQYPDNPQKGYEEYLRYPFEQFFNPLGMSSTVFEVDPVGTYIGSSYAWATARDWAKFGLLYLNNGKYFNRQLNATSNMFADGWIDFVRGSTFSSKNLYGGQFWIGGNNQQITEEELKYSDMCDELYPSRLFPKRDHWRMLPENSYFAHGFEEQMTLLSPDHNVVLIRLGCTSEILSWDKGGFYKSIMDLFPKY